MHVPFRIHYRNNLIDKKYLIEIKIVDLIITIGDYCVSLISLLVALIWSILTEPRQLLTGVKLVTVTAITVIPRWRTWNRVRIFFVD
jgi:hypothetical protein